MERKTASHATRRRVVTVESEASDSDNTTRTREIDDDPAPSEYESSPEDAATQSAPHTLLTEDPFSNDSSRILFDSIDELRKFGADQVLDLPQLVIVGKQSAGKSTLLQSLTDIPFPVGVRLCTRFATRIVSRRTLPGTVDVVKASIEPGDDDINAFNSVPDAARLKDFEQIIPSMTAEVFESLIEQAKEVMGINSDRGSDRQSFSSMVLRIELAGPKRSHFGILDVPGVFSTPIGHVKEREMDGVTAMVCSYMKRPENIIICVAEALGDISNEKILKLAKKVDSSRIIGVFTKCDRTETPETIVQIVCEGEGIENMFLRWHVVLNRGPASSDEFDRDEAENELFSQGAWLNIPAEQRGTPMLKKYLANLLCKRIRDAFPDMKDMVEKLLHDERAHRKTFGLERVDHGQRLAYLMSIITTYQDFSDKTLTSPGDLPFDDLKLRGFTEQEKERYALQMETEGHEFGFLDIGKAIESEYDPDASDSEDSPDRLSVPVSNFTQRGSPRRRGPPTPAASPSRLPPNHIPVRVNPLYAEIKTQMRKNRGEELPGMLNPAVLKPLWRKQTSKWEDLGVTHLNQIVRITTDIALQIFDLVATRVGMTERAMNKFNATITNLSDEAKLKIVSDFHALCERSATMPLQTTDSNFQTRVRAAQFARFQNAVGRFRLLYPPQNHTLAVFASSGTSTSSQFAQEISQCAIIDPANVQGLFNEMHPNGGRAQNTEDEIHDILKAYYDISLKNFIYDVNFNFVEPFLKSKTGPLLGLSTDYIMSLSESEIEELGGEDSSVVEGRANSDRQIEKLEKALRIAQAALRRTRELSL